LNCKPFVHSALNLNPIDFNEYQEVNFKTPPSLFQLSVCTQIQGYSLRLN
jgi:hypothetical protein